MERNNFLKLGAHCLQRLSLKTQRELLSLSEAGQPFSENVISELRDIENGLKFLSACTGKLSAADFMDILACCDQPTISRIIADDEHKQRLLGSPVLRGYIILENAAIYYTNDMDNTIRWFEKILGWKGVIDVRDEAGYGAYGYIVPYMDAYVAVNRPPYLQLMRGDIDQPVTAFIKVWGLGGLRQHILDNGWTEVSTIEEAGWGSRLFSLTTCDDCLLRFYEPNRLGA